MSEEKKKSPVEGDVVNEDGGEEVEVGSEGDESEYEEIDVTDNPLYQVLSAFFENEEGENLCDLLKDLTFTLKDVSKELTTAVKDLTKTLKQSK